MNRMARTIGATDREAAPAVYEQTGRVTGISEDYANKDLVAVSIELPAVDRNGDTIRPMAHGLIPRKAAGRFAIGDQVRVTTRIEKA